MCRRLAKYGLVMVLLMAAGFVVGGLLTMAVYIGLWWEFPQTWLPLTGLTSAPQAVLALQAPENRFLVRTTDGKLFTCGQAGCVSESTDWSAEALACDATTQPAVVSTFPVLLSRHIQVALGCERGYQSTGRTVYVIYDRWGNAFYSSGASMIPTDAGVIIVGILGGLVGLVVAVVVFGGIGVILLVSNRSKEGFRLEAEEKI